MGSTQRASVMIVPAPPTAYLARCWKCQSVALPSGPALYICIGAITILFGKVTSRSLNGLNRSDECWRACCMQGVPLMAQAVGWRHFSLALTADEDKRRQCMDPVLIQQVPASPLPNLPIGERSHHPKG